MQSWKLKFINSQMPEINNISKDLVNGRYQEFEEKFN
jgi:hypothetical protein